MYTGERILPGSMFNVTYQQSLSAYHFASQHAEGKTVLDVACGTGYGLPVIAAVAKEVVGADRDQHAVDKARSQYQQSNISFVHSDLFHLAETFSHARFDVVCCFQTIEHIENHHAFLQALKAVIKPGGMVIISTPNKNQFPSFNPYHVHELDEPELRQLCAKHFPTYHIYGVHGSPEVQRYRASKQKIGKYILKLDVINARRWLPQPILKAVYNALSFLLIKRLSWLRHRRTVEKITQKDFTISPRNLQSALDFIVIGTLSG